MDRDPPSDLSRAAHDLVRAAPAECDANVSGATVVTRRGTNLLVALVYLVLALWVHRAILPAPRTLLPLPTALVGTPAHTVYQGDQLFVAATIASNAHKLLHDPASLAGDGFCHPMRASYVLGEHMFGESLLAVPAYAASGDPILSFNAVVILSVWIAALAMYALALSWTGSAPAAFVAGMLFAFHAARLSNPAHPFVYGNLWTPVALLFAERLFARRRWVDATGLALALVLQLLESFYQVLALAILGGVFGLHLLVVHRRSLRALVPQLVAVATVVGAVTYLVLGPYLQARNVWGVLQGRATTLLVPWRDYLPGGYGWAGLVALVLAVFGLADRLRRQRLVGGLDPRIPMLSGGVLLLWATAPPIRVPHFGWRIANPLRALAGVLPGLDAVRVLASLRFGVFLVVALLAAYGVLFLTERLRASWAWPTAALLALLALAEAYDPSQTLTPRSAQLETFAAAPPARAVELVRDLAPGAVLDLPLEMDGPPKLRDMPRHLILAAYHQRPVAACYNSFPSPLKQALTDLTDSLPAPGAADALHALGFRTILLHVGTLGAAGWARLAPLLADERRISNEGAGGDIVRLSLSSSVSVTTTLATLATPAGHDRTPQPVATIGASHGVEFEFVNRTELTFRHPTLAPLALSGRWYDPTGTPVGSARVRGMLPLALGPGQRTRQSLEVEVPAGVAPGRYRVDVTTDTEPTTVLAWREIELAAP